MKQIIAVAAFLFVVSATYATALPRHNDERNILSTELPASLQSDIKSTYAGYWITELTEEGEGKHAKYQLTLENADQIVHLRADKSSDWEVVSTNVKAD
jgi:hypothetical protein